MLCSATPAEGYVAFNLSIVLSSSSARSGAQQELPIIAVRFVSM
jgi:hypothetical protein